MADDSGMVIGAVNQASNDIQDTMILLDDDITKELRSMSGLNDTKEDPVAQLKAITEILTGISDAMGIKESAQAADPSGGKVAEITGFGKKDDDDKEDKDGGDKPGKDKPKLSDVVKLGAKAGMGSILVYHKLDEIYSMLKMYIKKSDGKGKPEPKGGGGKKDDKISLTSKDLGKQIKDVAAGLKEFGKACIFLALIPKKLANAGLDLFVKFMDRYVGTLRKYSKDLNKVTKFNTTIVKLAAGLKSFAGACWILALSIPVMALSTFVGLPMIGTFLNAIILIMKNVKKEMQNFYIFTQACVLIGISFILMAVAFMLMGLALPYIPKALVGLALSLAIFVLVAVISYFLAFTVLPLMAIFAFACVLMGIAFILMTVAIRVLSDFKPDWNNVNDGLEQIVHLVICIAKMTGWLLLGTIAIVLLTVFGVGFMLSMVSLVVGVLFAWLLSIMPVEEIVGKLFASGDDGDGAILALIKCIGKAIGWILLGTISIVFLTAFSALFMVSMITMLLGMLAARKVYKIVQENPEMVTTLFAKDGMVDVLTKELSKSIGFFILGTISLVFGMAFSIEFMIFAACLLIAVNAMVGIKKGLSDLGGTSEIASMAKTIKDATMGLLLGVVGMDYQSGQSIGFGTIFKVGMTAGVMKKVANQVKDAVKPAAKAIKSMEQIAVSVKVMHKALEGVDKHFIELIFNGISMIMDSLAEVAKAFKGSSEETVKAIGECLVNVVTALDKIVDLVIKLKDGIPEEQVTAATETMLMICSKLFGVGRTLDWNSPPEQYTLIDTLQALSSVELTEGSVQAAKAIEPLMKGIGAAVEVVECLSDPERFSKERMALGIDNLNSFITLIQMGVVPMIKAMSEQIPDGGYQTVSTKSSFAFVSWSSEKSVATTQSVMQMMNNLIQQGFVKTLKDLFGGIAQAIDYLSDLNASDLSGIIDFLGSGVITIVNGSKNFSDAMVILNKAFDGNGDKGIASLFKGKGADGVTIDQKFSRFADALMKFGSVDFVQGAAGLMIIAKSTEGLNGAADAMERMANALGAIGDSEKKTNSVFDKIFKAKDYLTAQFNDINTAAGESIAVHVQTMANIMGDWNKNGIPIRGKIQPDPENPEEQKIKPDDVGNGVVKKK